MDSLILEYEDKIGFPSEDVYAALVTGHFEKLEKIVHSFNIENKNTASPILNDDEDKYTESEIAKDNLMYG